MTANTTKEKYNQLCENEYIPVFSQPWWLDIVAGPENWGVVLGEHREGITSAMPFTMKKIGAIKIFKMPKLTPWIHIWFKYAPDMKYNSRLAFEKEELDALLPQLPSSIRFYQKYSYGLTNWLPFYWRGFRQTTRYSYIIDDLRDLDAVYAAFKKNNRYEIRKAQKILSIIDAEDIDSFYRINGLAFKRQNIKMPYSLQFLQNLDAACKARQCRKIFFAVDADERVHAVLYLLWDERSAYYLMGGADPDLRSSGATSLLIWHAIRFAATVSQKFDFEGSMMAPIEKFFRSFGARQTPYFAISKNKFPMNFVELLR